jgi:hypothetical protein
VGVKLFPLKGHEITGWYMYRGMINTNLLEIAFNQPAGSIRKTQYHELAGDWLWTLTPYFDIRLAGVVGIPGGGYRDLAKLANCNTTAVAPVVACSGNDIALAGEARFRARF